MSEQHGVRVVQLSTSSPPSSGVLIQCLCGDIAGNGFWTVTRHDDGTATLSPSINFTGHFHTDNPVRVPVGDVDLSLRSHADARGWPAPYRALDKEEQR